MTTGTGSGRKAWLSAFRREAARSVGAHHLGVTFRYCRAEFEATLTVEEKTALAAELAALDPAAASIPAAVARPFVKAWTQAELEPQLAAVAGALNTMHGHLVQLCGRDVEAGRVGPGQGVFGGVASQIVGGHTGRSGGILWAIGRLGGGLFGRAGAIGCVTGHRAL